MSKAIGAPQQHKQPSRKGKKAWRKNVDITEVQQGLDSLREEIIHGGPVAEKTSEELFVVDTIGSEEIKKRHRLQKPLKVDQILAQRSAVPAVDSRKRTISRVTDGVIEPSSKRQKSDWVAKKEIQRLKNSINQQSHLSAERMEGDESSTFDLWAANPDTVANTTERNEYIPKPRSKVTPSTLSIAPIAMTASGRSVRAVVNPDAGTSYNPSFDDWDSLVTKEGQKLVEEEQLRLQQVQAEEERQAGIVAAGAEAEAGYRTDEESAWEGFDTENDDADVLKRKRPERKTPAQRNKINRKKKADQLANHEKATAKKQEQFSMSLAKTMERDLTEKETGSSEAPAPANEDDVKLRHRRVIGNSSLPEKHLELVLPDELQESLRRLKPEGNLMNDRFRHLLINGKIESRKPVLQSKKRKVKVTEKWSHKDFRIEV